MDLNVSLPPSSNLSLHPPLPSIALLFTCTEVTLGTHMFTAASCTYILVLLPLCVFILHLGLQRRRRRRSAMMSNADFFTYNIIVLELIAMLGSCFYCCGAYISAPQIKLVGNYLLFIVTPTQSLFHTLTCLERYLAVVHPVFYLGLRNSGGVKLRNISTGLVWGVSCVWAGLSYMYGHSLPTIPIIIILTFSVIITSFFSLSVLCTLIRPGPGEGGGDRANQLKKRAFNTITAITVAVLLRLGGMLFSVLLSVALGFSCTVLLSLVWFCLPSSYVLPLLFLHRAGKLPCFRTTLTEQRSDPR